MIFKTKLSFVLYLLAVLLPLCGRIITCVGKENNDIQTTEPEVIIIPDPLRERAEQIASSLDDSALAAQVLITGIDGTGRLPQHMRVLLEEIPAGGVMLFRHNVNASNDSIRSLITETASLITERSGVAPFVAVDLEGGMVNRFAGNKELPFASSLPAPSSYWMKHSEIVWEEGHDIPHELQQMLKEIEKDSYNAAREVSALGINLNFAPIAEYLNYDNMTFLLYRSYGPDPNFTAEAAASFFYSMRSAGILCVVKHFPGSAGRDPHHVESVLNLEIDPLWKNDLNLAAYVYPFSNLFSKGARAVMVAHTLIPAIDSKVASLSSVVMNDWLRVELGFDGIIIADDFSMAAAGNLPPEQSAVLSVEAGADMILVWPNNLRRTHAEFLTALNDGRLKRDRLQEAVSRIIYEKLRMGL